MGFCPKNHQFSQKRLLSWFVFTLSFYLLSRNPDYKQLFSSTSFPQIWHQKSTMSEGSPDYPFSGQTFYPLHFQNVFSLLHRLCPFFSYYLFLNPNYSSYFFYEHSIVGSDTKGVLTTLYLMVITTESRMNTGFSLSCPDSTGVSQGCQSTIPIRKKSLQKQKRDLALWAIHSLYKVS